MSASLLTDQEDHIDVHLLVDEDSKGAYYGSRPPASQSTNLLPDDALSYPTRLTDMYSRDDHRQQMYTRATRPPKADPEPFYNQMLPPTLEPRPSSSIPFSIDLQHEIHSPVPLRVADPYSVSFTGTDLEIFESSPNLRSPSEPSLLSYSPLKSDTDPPPDFTIGHRHREQNINIDSYTSDQLPQKSYPIPSDLLTKLPTPATEEHIIRRPIGSTRKAHRHAIRKSSIGFASPDS